MVNYTLENLAGRCYYENEIIEGLPERNDIVLAKDGTQKIFMGDAWYRLTITEYGFREKLIELLAGKSIENMHQDLSLKLAAETDPNRIKEKLEIWEKNLHL